MLAVLVTLTASSCWPVSGLTHSAAAVSSTARQAAAVVVGEVDVAGNPEGGVYETHSRWSGMVRLGGSAIGARI